MSNWSIKQRLREEILEAVEKGDVSKAQELLDKGADVNESEGGYLAKKTVLLLAIENSHEHMAKLLVDRGADLTVTVTITGKKMTIADMARDKSMPNLADYIANKMEMNARLVAAVRDGLVFFVQDNLNRGADLNVMYTPTEIDQPNCTLLQLALIKGQLEVAQYLIQCGVDLHYVMKWEDQTDDTARSYAERMNYDDIVKSIDQRLEQSSGNTALHNGNNNSENHKGTAPANPKNVEVYDIEDLEEDQEETAVAASQQNTQKKNGNCVIS